MRSIILAGGPADRQSIVPEGLPRPFWPLAMRPLVYRLIDQLMATGIDAISVCANGRTTLYALRLESERFKLHDLHFTQDPLPRGPAGCVKDNEAVLGNEPFLVVGAACWLTDSAESLIHRHHQQGNKLTMFCLPNTKTPSGVYVFDPEVLDHIPKVGYCDIKEQLVPRLLDRGLRVAALALREPAAEVVNARSYLLLHHRVLAGLAENEAKRSSGLYEPIGPDQWKARTATVSPRARLFGPVMVGAHAMVADRAVIIGPVAIGPRVVIEEDAIVTESVVWEGARLGRGKSAFRAIVAAGGVDSRGSQTLRWQLQGARYQESGAHV